MIIREAIVLAGGLGTRLRAAVPDLPKCMAPVGGRPFIGYVTDYFRQAGIQRFIFALGYKHSAFDDFFRQTFPEGGYVVSLEQEPLGTGGAIRQACTFATEQTVLILNGDTFFRIALEALSAFHYEHKADCSLCLKPMRDFDRFGVVERDGQQQVRHFREKQYYAEGLINGGVYALDKEKFLQENLPPVFSFEKDYLEKVLDTRRVYGLVQDTYFIDIGIPEDYQRVQHEVNQLL
ncbi:nucleotidyltransferase family protein [Puia dinghuensis]|uniref:D-mannose-1-phosphate guanyltransferase n=1 Tax=Puia dinghuensis TaxID=1792502 RepID=A0A8J2UEH1_9BACT|nr:nucleotidyltransferase family protein [Puia dinghuensis]GGB06452.1 D-mannose-1-phosphate guanyltransferase [Puia dinghuensis]